MGVRMSRLIDQIQRTIAPNTQQLDPYYNLVLSTHGMSLVTEISGQLLTQVSFQTEVHLFLLQIYCYNLLLTIQLGSAQTISTIN